MELQVKFNSSLQEANQKQEMTMRVWLGVEVEKSKKDSKQSSITSLKRHTTMLLLNMRQSVS
jgi:hypothetical protein